MLKTVTNHPQKNPIAHCITALFMASGCEDEIKGAWYFGSSQYDPQSSSELEQEPVEMVEQQGERQDNHH